jgi:adenylosuccinate lyase
MIVHPIDYRYGTPEMKRIWSEDSKIKRMIWVEIALLRALAKRGYLDEDKVQKAQEQALNVSVERVKEIEEEIKHDIMALVKAISEVVDEDVARWVHFGATSNDIVDCAVATQLRDSLKVLEAKLVKLVRILCDKALEYRDVVCLGRTHGQPALPTTYGFRFAVWVSELARHFIRLQQIKDRLLVGQMSGAVGTQAGFGKDGLEIERDVMTFLGLKPVLISTQIIPRDIYCEYVEFLSNLATTLEKIATNIRVLQRGEVGELMEEFGKKQVGSSTMPHKRNPIDCENICGIARVVRGFVEPMHQSSILWEERDLTNSSAERIILVESSVLVDHILTKTIRVIEKLRIDFENVERNLKRLRGLNLSEAVMIALTKKGLNRQEAHALVREISMRAYSNDTSLLDEILKDERIMAYFSREELENILKPENYLGTAKERVEMVVEWVSNLLDGYD